MSNKQKILGGVTAFMVIMLFLIFLIPNFKEGGNKNILPTGLESKEETAHTEAKMSEPAEETKKEGTSVTVVNAENKPGFKLTFTAFKTP